MRYEIFAPGGIFAQWVPILGSMRGDLFRIHLNTFQKVFPNTTFWYVYGSDQAFLMATPEPFEDAIDRLQPVLPEPEPEPGPFQGPSPGISILTTEPEVPAGALLGGSFGKGDASRANAVAARAL